MAQACALVENLMARDFEPVRSTFDATMTAAVSEQVLARIVDDLLEKNGPVKSHSVVRQSTRGDYMSVYVTTVQARATRITRVVFDRNGKVAGLLFAPAQAP